MLINFHATTLYYKYIFYSQYSAVNKFLLRTIEGNNFCHWSFEAYYNSSFLVNLVSYTLWFTYLKLCVLCVAYRYAAYLLDRRTPPAAFIFESKSALGSMTRASYPLNIMTLRNETAKCRSRFNYCLLLIASNRGQRSFSMSKSYT